ncbi:Lar family restriction alleviation protein [Pseudomonas veronii]
MTTNQTIDGVPLLPCPFCGGEPYGTHDHYVYDDLSPMPCVECQSCSAHLKAEDWNRRVQPAPVAVVLPERSNQDYAIEHAEYMALSADDVLAKFQAYGLALLAVDEGGDDGEGELLENIDSARSNLQESLVELRSMVYEFRKRSAKSR